MSGEIVVALISMAGSVLVGLLSLVGVISANRRAAKDTETKLHEAQAVTNTKLEELTKQVEKHNQVVERTYKLEGEVKELQHDVVNLQGYHKP